MKNPKPPTNGDALQSIRFIWSKLHGYAEECIPYWKYEETHPEDAKAYEEEWDDICTAMSWIEDECDVELVEGILQYKTKGNTK